MQVTVHTPSQTLTGTVDATADLGGTFILIDAEGVHWTVDGWLLDNSDLEVER